MKTYIWFFICKTKKCDLKRENWELIFIIESKYHLWLSDESLLMYSLNRTRTGETASDTISLWTSAFIKAGRSDDGKGHFWAIHPANFQDFSNGDYHRRRARRRIRRVTGQLPFTLPAHYQSLSHLKRTPCWCCPPTHPLICFSPRVYWNWAALQTHRRPSLHGLI